MVKLGKKSDMYLSVKTDERPKVRTGYPCNGELLGKLGGRWFPLVFWLFSLLRASCEQKLVIVAIFTPFCLLLLGVPIWLVLPLWLVLKEDNLTH